LPLSRLLQTQQRLPNDDNDGEDEKDDEKDEYVEPQEGALEGVTDGLGTRQIGIVLQVFPPLAHALLVLLARAALEDEEDQLDDDEEDDEDEENPRSVVGQQQSGQIEGYEYGRDGADMADGSRNQINPFPNAVAAGMLVRVVGPEEEDDGLEEDADPDDDEEDGIVAVIPVPDPAEVQEPEEQADDGEDNGDVEEGAMPRQPDLLAADGRVGPHAAVEGDEQDVDAHEADPGDQIRQDVGLEQGTPVPADGVLVAEADAGSEVDGRGGRQRMRRIRFFGQVVAVAHLVADGDPDVRLVDVAQIQDLLLLALGNALPLEDAADARLVIFALDVGQRMLLQQGIDVVFVAHVQDGHRRQLLPLVAHVGVEALADDGVVIAETVVLGEAQRHPTLGRRRQLELDDVADLLPAGVPVALRLHVVVLAPLEAAFRRAALRQIEGASLDLRVFVRRRRHGRLHAAAGKEGGEEEQARNDEEEGEESRLSRRCR